MATPQTPVTQHPQPSQSAHPAPMDINSIVDDEILSLSADDIIRRARLVENETKMLKQEVQRVES